MTGEHWHGTTNGYYNQNCRCPECREAHRVYHADYMKRHPEQRERHRLREAARYAAGETTWHRAKRA